MNDKIETIKKVLEPFWERDLVRGCAVFKLNALAKQAIVISMEVKHREYRGDKYTVLDDTEGIPSILLTGDVEGHHGTPGKALAIILSLEEEK